MGQWWRAWGCAACLGAFSAGLPAAEPSTGHAASRLDPTDFRTRYDFRNRYQAPQAGGHRNLATSRLDYAFSKTFVLRAELPWVVNAPPGAGTPTVSGVGDLMLRPSFRVLRKRDYALVVGTEFLFDTADSRSLGAGKDVVAPIAFLSFDVPRLATTFFPTVQYFRSVAGDDDRADLDYTTAKLFALTRWPWHLYTGTEAVLFFDHAHQGRVGATLEVETGLFVSRHVALWVRPGIGSHGDDLPQVYSWNFEVGFRYLFD